MDSHRSLRVEPRRGDRGSHTSAAARVARAASQHGIAFVGNLFGLYEHIERNMAFALEIRPHAVASEVLTNALRGVNPLLAPGILTLAAVLALSATYYPPALQGRKTLRPWELSG